MKDKVDVSPKVKDAFRLWETGKYKKCPQLIKKLQESPEPQSKTRVARLLYLQGEVLFDLKKYRDAVKCYDKSLKVQASDVVCGNKGLALWELGQNRRALESYKRAIRLNPRNAIAQGYVGELYVESGSPKKALPFLQRALELNKNLQERSEPLSQARVARLLYLEAEALYELKKYRDAVKYYDKSLEVQANDAVCTSKGFALWELRQYRRALKSFKRAVRLNSKNEIALRGIGEAYFRTGSPKLALPFLKRALKLKPDYQRVYTCLGIVYFQLKDWTRSYRMLLKAYKMDPNDWQAKRGIDKIEKIFDL
jgi:tetratricopeptide (TPR) repeat protein